MGKPRRHPQGCLEDIKRRLGYRLELVTGIFPGEARPGQAIPLRLELRNVGFAAPFNPRGLELVRRAIAESELPARVFHPTHVNRRKTLFDEAVALTKQGVTIDITAFPVADGEDAYSAEDALMRCLAAGVSPDRVTVSSDGGGCLPVFDVDGRVTQMDVGDPGALALTLSTLLARGVALENALPPFTRNVARLLRLDRKGQVAVGADADLVTLDASGHVRDVMARGAWHMRDGALVKRGTFERGE
jgi:beta-aspartyl-dipeptidase (metallo-type)